MISNLSRCSEEIIKTVRNFDNIDTEFKKLKTEVGEIILAHSCNDSRSARLVAVKGIGYVVPNHVADELKELRDQVKQLQTHVAELTRDNNIARAADF